MTLFENADCRSIVCVGSISGQILSQELQDPGINDVINELTSNRTGYQFYIINIPSHIPDIAALKKYCEAQDSIIVGIQGQKHQRLLPHIDYQIEAGDKVVLIANKRPILA